MTKKIIFFLSFFILVFIITLLTFLNKKSFTSFNDLDVNESSFIAHAGGGFKDVTYSNSRESVIESIQKGFKLIELDLLETSDGFIVAAHDWKTFKENCLDFKGQVDNNPITYQEFNECNYQINSINFTKLNEENINKIFNNNTDLYLVTDKIRNYKLLSKKFSFKERIIPEIFTIYGYISSKFYGFERPIFPFKKYNFFVQKFFNVRLINISYKDFIKNKEKVTNLFNKGLEIYVYTSNDKTFIENNINKNITGIYTDFWNFNMKRCESENKCRSY